MIYFNHSKEREVVTMTDMDKTVELLNKYEIDFHTTILYSTTDKKPCGWAMWLSKGGHLEFDFDKKLVNIVEY
jgi:hypothetical protein